MMPLTRFTVCMSSGVKMVIVESELVFKYGIVAFGGGRAFEGFYGLDHISHFCVVQC